MKTENLWQTFVMVMHYLTWMPAIIFMRNCSQPNFISFLIIIVGRIHPDNISHNNNLKMLNQIKIKKNASVQIIVSVKRASQNTSVVSLKTIPHGLWQSFITIASCNHIMRIISTYVSNTNKSDVSWRQQSLFLQLFKFHNQVRGIWKASSYFW